MQSPNSHHHVQEEQYWHVRQRAVLSVQQHKLLLSVCFSSQSVPLDFLASGARSNVTAYTACPATTRRERVAAKRGGEGGTVTNVSVCGAFSEQSSGWCGCSSLIPVGGRILSLWVGSEVLTGMGAAGLSKGVALCCPAQVLTVSPLQLACLVTTAWAVPSGAGALPAPPATT